MISGTRLAAGALCLLLVSGCDAINGAINDALPEISISSGVLGLGGSTGTAISGSFAAGKVAAIAQFQHGGSFADLNTGDITNASQLKTSLGLAVGDAAVILTRNSAEALPNSFTITASSVTWTLSDAAHASITESSSKSFSATLTRNSSCAATAASCTYSGAAGSATAIIADYDLSEAVAADVIALVGQTPGAASTENSIVVTISLTVDPGAGDYDGVTATIRVNEQDTVVQADLF